MTQCPGHCKYSIYEGLSFTWSEVAQSCPTLCNPMDCSLPGSSVHGIFQATVLEWIAISFSRGSSWPRDWTQVSYIVDTRFTVWATREVIHSFNSACVDIYVLSKYEYASFVTCTPGPWAHASEWVCAQLYPTLCNPMRCSSSGSSVHGSFQEDCSGLSFPPPEIFPIQGWNPSLLHLLRWQVDSSRTELPEKPLIYIVICMLLCICVYIFLYTGLYIIFYMCVYIHIFYNMGGYVYFLLIMSISSHSLLGDLPDPRTELRSPALQADSLLSEPPQKLLHSFLIYVYFSKYVCFYLL